MSWRSPGESGAEIVSESPCWPTAAAENSLCARREVLDALRERHRPYRDAAVPRHARPVTPVLQHDEVECAPPPGLLRSADHEVAPCKGHRRRGRGICHQDHQPGIRARQRGPGGPGEVLDAVVTRAREQERHRVRLDAEPEAAGAIGEERIHRPLSRCGEGVQHDAGTGERSGVAPGESRDRAAHARLGCHAHRQQQCHARSAAARLRAEAAEILGIELLEVMLEGLGIDRRVGPFVARLDPGVIEQASAAKMGACSRRARAMLSDGRASTWNTWSSRWICSSAK